MVYTLESLIPQEVLTDPIRIISVFEQGNMDDEIFRERFIRKIEELANYAVSESLEKYAGFELKLLGCTRVRNLTRFKIIKKNDQFLSEIEKKAREEKYGDTQTFEKRPVSVIAMGKIIKKNNIFYEGARKYQIFADNTWGENVRRILC